MRPALNPATRSKLAVVGLALLLSGCSGALAPLPMVTVSSSGIVLQGTLTPSMDFSGTFSLASIDGTVTCQGRTASTGKGSMTCSDGQTADLSIPKPPYGRFNGAYVDTFPWGKAAVGWGKYANADSLRAMLP